MNNRFRIPAQAHIVFVTGAVILGIELTASRYMAPMFGSSLYIWGAILSTTLACLSVGYAWGGRLGESAENPVRKLVLFIVIAAIWLGLLPFLQKPVAYLGFEAGSMFGPVIVMALLFALPITLLATSTPLVFAQNNRLQAGEQASRTMGDLFALGTIGSVGGALVTAYLLIPAVGLRTTLFVLAACLLLVVIKPVWDGYYLKTVAFSLCLMAALEFFSDPLAVTVNHGMTIIHRESSAYGELTVLEQKDDKSRILLLDGTTQNWVKGKDLEVSLFEYVDVITAHLDDSPPPLRKVLVVGLGAGALTRQLHSHGYEVETVELDAQIYDVAKKYFKLPPELNVAIADGRAFMHQATSKGKKYGAIVLDVTAGSGQPGYLFDLEAFHLVKQLLTPDGVLVINQLVILNQQENKLASYTLSTLDLGFTHVRGFNIEPYQTADDVINLLIFASDSPPSDPQYRSTWNERLVLTDRESLPALTDNWNPMELWTIEVNSRTHRNMREFLGADAIIPM